MQAQQAAQQAQHAAQVESTSREAAEMESLIRHGEQQDQQRVAELNAHRAEANDLKQVTMEAVHHCYSVYRFNVLRWNNRC